MATIAAPNTTNTIPSTEPTTQPHTHSIQLLHNAVGSGLPHGLGLLTTVASLPPKYRSRYLNIKTKCEIPLDLSVKPLSPQIANDVPMATAFAEVHTEPAAKSPTSTPTPTPAPTPATELPLAGEEVVIMTEKPITPPQSPAKRKFNELDQPQSGQPAKIVKIQKQLATKSMPTELATPAKPIKTSDTAPRTSKAAAPTSKPSRNKATRKLKFDEETSSPVSGTIIRPLEDITDGSMQYSNGDIDPKYNIVEITEETKAELAAIKNVIGDYVCKLCRIKFDDAFGLARHRCACIVLLEYRCPECGKQFNCPANLASHRRWHKPKKEAAGASNAKKENRNTINQPAQPVAIVTKKTDDLPFSCAECGKSFKRQAYLRKHQQTHAKRKQDTAQCSSPARTVTSTTTITASFQAAPYKSNSSSSSSSHSYAGTHEDEGVYVVGATGSHCDYEADYMSDSSSSSSSAGYGRLQIVEQGLTEEESIAAAALTNLRNCASVIQHTTLAH